MADNILRVGTEFDVGPLVAGAKAAGAAMDDVGKKMGDASKATLDLLYPTQELNTEQRETVSTNAELAAAIAALTAQINNLATAKRSATTATGGMTSAMGAARVEMGLMEGSLGMIAGGLARVAAQSALLAPIIQAAFAPLAVVAFVDIAVHAAEAIYKVYQNVILLKAQMDALNKAGEIEAHKAADLNYQYDEGIGKRLEAQASLLESQGKLGESQKVLTEAAQQYAKAASEKPLELPKIDDKLFKSLNAELVTFLQATHSVSDIPTVVARLGGEAESTQKQLDAAKVKLEDLKATQERLKTEEGTADPTRGGAVAGGVVINENQIKREEASVANLTTKYELLRTMIGTIQSQSGIEANAAADQQDAASRKIQDITNKENKAAEEAAKKAAEEQLRIVKENIEAQKKMQEDLAKTKIPEGASDLTVLGLPNEALFADYYAKIGDDAMEAFKKIRDEGESSSSELDIALLKDIGTLGAEWKKASEKRLAEEKKVNEEIQKENQKTAEMISKIFQNGFDGVIKGTETLRQGFLKLYDDIGLALIHEGEKEIALELAQVARKVAIHLGMEQAKTAATAAGETQRDSLEEIHFIKFVALELKKVAVWIATEAEKTAVTIASEAARLAVIIANHFVVMSHYAAEAAAAVYAALAPIPFVGPFIAPVAAAAAYAAVLAFQAGGVMPHEGMAHLHEQEMVLPANISRPLQAAIPSIQNFNMAMQRDGGAAAAGAAGPGSSTVHNHNGRVEVHVHTPGTQMTHADMVRAVRVAMRSGELRSIP